MPYRFSAITIRAIISIFLISLLLSPFTPTTSVVRAASIPTVALAVPSTIFANSSFSFTATFSSVSTGYGPLIDLLLPADVTFIDATYLGSPVTNSTPVNFPGPGTTCTNHPFIVDTTNTPIQVCGPQGSTYVALQLPFGSFVGGQTPAEITINAAMGNITVGTPLSIFARGAFQFGANPLNDWCCDPPVDTLSVASSNGIDWLPAPVIPLFLKLTKTYDGPENETATGPNFPHSYTLTAEIPAGQTLTNLRIFDDMPARHQFISPAISSPPGATINFTPPPGSLTGGVIEAIFPSATGTVSVTIPFIAPEIIGPVGATLLDPLTGVSVGSQNNTHATADTGGPGGGTGTVGSTPGTPCIGGASPCLTRVNLFNRSLAIQKTADKDEYRVGDTATYTLNFQASDFFSFDDIVIRDLLGDAQNYVPNSATLSLTLRNGQTITPAWTETGPAPTLVIDTSEWAGAPAVGNNPISFPATNPGGTGLTFRLSDLMRTLPIAPVGASEAQQGILRGGRTVDPAGTTAVSGTITYRVDIQNQFRRAFLPNDANVNLGDLLFNKVQIQGEVLDPGTLNPTGNTPTDDSETTVNIQPSTLAKSIFAINGNIVFDPTQVAPGDLITYRLQYQMPLTSFEQLMLVDFLPLPLIDVNGFNPTFDTTSIGVIPPLNTARFGPADTFFGAGIGPAPANCAVFPAPPSNTGQTSVPCILINLPKNSLSFNYGSYQDPTVPPRPSTIDILFTVRVTDDPFADKLVIANNVHASQGTTNTVNSKLDASVKMTVHQPDVVLDKGIVATTNSGAVFTPNGGTPNIPAGPVGVIFNAPGASGPRWSGLITASKMKAVPISNRISGLKAGDKVTFALVLTNRGTGANGAFNLTVRDSLPPEFVMPATGYNMHIAYGDNSATLGFKLPSGAPADPSGADLFTTGIKLDDPSSTLGACQSELVSPGRSAIVITFDTVVTSDIPASTTVINRGDLDRFTSTQTGANFLTGGTLTSTATMDLLESSTGGSGGGGTGGGISAAQAAQLARLGFQKKVDSPIAWPGKTVNYTIIVTNPSTDPISGVVVNDLVPDTLIVQSVTTTQGTGTFVGNAVSVNVGTVAANATVTITIQVQVRADIKVPSDVINTATMGNMTASASLQVVRAMLPSTGEHPDEPIGVASAVILELALAATILGILAIKSVLTKPPYSGQ